MQSNPWGSHVVSYHYVLGDGSPDVTTTEPQISHTYVTPGTWSPSVTATTDTGQTVSTATSVQVEQPAPLTAQLGLSRVGGSPMTVTASLGESSAASGWPVTGRTVNWGDGSVTQSAGTQKQLSHAYARPGRYQVTQTSTDADGRTSKSVATTVVGSAFVAHAPLRLLDTRTTLGGHRARLPPTARSRSR
ncbi:PKD domain-containing protein [Streptacidiphilus monticola]